MLFTLVALSACGSEEHEIYVPTSSEQTSAPGISSTEPASSTGGSTESPVYEGIALLNNYTEEIFSTDDAHNTAYKAAYDKFAVDFFKTVIDSDKEGNVCLSPFSAYMAFSLCFMGSGGVTAEEFEKVFGLKKEDAAKYCKALYGAILQADHYDEKTKVNIANSIWIDNKFAAFVKEDYLVNATDYFNAPVYRGDFDDQATVDALNQWCSDNTDGLIKKIIDGFDESQFMALVNALLVEAAWREAYEEYEIAKYDFTNKDGSKKPVDFLHKKISVFYQADDCLAIKRSLKDGFSFVGILPNEDVSVDEYISSLTAQKLNALLGNPTYGYDVYTRIPKFNIDYDVRLNDVMKTMGLSDAFDRQLADFRSLAEIPDANVYIGTAKQKTHFELDENGIKAAAVTYIGVDGATAMPDPRPTINIYLDRPFVYMLMDDATGLPLFIGTIKEL